MHRGPYDFKEVKRTVARYVARTIEEGLAESIPLDEWYEAANLLKRYDLNVVVHALIAAITHKMAMKKNGCAVPPFHYQDGERKPLLVKS
jgi:hypothetical protein